jgi:hypothetical protein
VTSPSGTKSQILLPISAELSFSTLSIKIPNDTSPKEIIASRLLKKISSVSKIPRIYSTAKKELSFFSLQKLIKSRSETDEEEIMPNSREILSINSPSTTSGLQGQKMQKKNPENRYSLSRVT